MLCIHVGVKCVLLSNSQRCMFVCRCYVTCTCLKNAATSITLILFLHNIRLALVFLDRSCLFDILSSLTAYCIDCPGCRSILCLTYLSNLIIVFSNILCMLLLSSIYWPYSIWFHTCVSLTCNCNHERVPLIKWILFLFYKSLCRMFLCKISIRVPLHV